LDAVFKGDGTGTSVGLNVGSGKTLSVAGSLTGTGTNTFNAITSAAATALTLKSAGTTAITVDTSQNVGIGTASPSSKLDVSGVVSLQGTTLPSAGTARLYSRSSDSSFYMQSATGGSINLLDGSQNSMALFGSSLVQFLTGNTERMRINSSGYVGFNTTSFSNSNGAPGFVYAYSGGSQNAVTTYTSSTIAYGSIFEYRRTGRSNARVAQISFGENASAQGEVYVFSSAANADVSGGVYVSNGATSWSSASDERLKDIIEPILNGLTKVVSLRSVIGKYKTDAEGTRRSFLIAQDVQAVLPEAISSTKVQGNETEYLGVSYSDVIPLLVASIKELKAINDTQAETINALTTRIVALEARA
jgi:hypothetical protein